MTIPRIQHPTKRRSVPVPEWAAGWPGDAYDRWTETDLAQAMAAAERKAGHKARLPGDSDKAHVRCNNTAEPEATNMYAKQRAAKAQHELLCLLPEGEYMTCRQVMAATRKSNIVQKQIRRIYDAGLLDRRNVGQGKQLEYGYCLNAAGVKARDNYTLPAATAEVRKGDIMAALLRDGESTSYKLGAAVGIDPSGTTQYLHALKRQGVVAMRLVGRTAYWRAVNKGGA